ncbi:MAG: OmpA family protein [Myxococcota bacterium]
MRSIFLAPGFALRGRMIVAAAIGLGLVACGGQERTRPVQQAVVNEWTLPASSTGYGHNQWVHVPAAVLFPSGSAALTRESMQLLDEGVTSMQSRNDIARLRVEGHADTEGSELGNYSLSSQRAEAVRAYLVQRGVPYQLIEIVSFGSDRPVVIEDGYEVNRARNRRVEFSVLFRR